MFFGRVQAQGHPCRDGVIFSMHHQPDPSPALSDTDDSAHARYLAMIAELSPAARLLRAFELSAFMRDVALTGARMAAGARGERAVRDRFLEQLYGTDMSDELRLLISRL
jgi:hypothetical protein